MKIEIPMTSEYTMIMSKDTSDLQQEPVPMRSTGHPWTSASNIARAAIYGIALTLHAPLHGEDRDGTSMSTVQKSPQNVTSDPSMTAIIGTQEPTETVRHWIASPQNSRMSAEFTRLVGYRDTHLDSPIFHVREQSHREIIAWMRATCKIVHPLPEETLAALRHSAHDSLTLEQRIRIGAIDHEYRDKRSTYPSRLPPLSTTPLQLCEELRRYFGFNIHVDDEMLSHFLEGNITTTLDDNDFASMLRKLCATTKTIPQWTTNGLEFVSDKEGTTRLLPLDRAFMTWRPAAEESEPDSITIVPDPQWTPGVLHELSLEGAWPNDVIVHLPGYAPWQIDRGGHRPTNARTVKRNPQSAGSAVIVFDSWCASNPVPTTFFIGRTFPITVGFQQWEARLEEHSPTWKCMMISSIYGHIPWPATTCDTDQQTYAAANGTRCVLYDAQDAMIPYVQERISIDQRLMTFAYRCERQPTKAILWPYTRLQRELRRIPVDGGPSSRETIEPGITITGSH